MHNYTYGAGRRKERRKLYNCDRMSMEISYGKRQRETETRSISCDMLIIAMKRDNDRYEKYASNRFLNRAFALKLTVYISTYLYWQAFAGPGGCKLQRTAIHSFQILKNPYLRRKKLSPEKLSFRWDILTNSLWILAHLNIHFYFRFWSICKTIKNWELASTLSNNNIFSP